MVKLVLWVLFLFLVYIIAKTCYQASKEKFEVSDFWPALQVVVLCLIGLAITGCSTLAPDGAGTEWKHDSVLLRGAPFTDRTDVDGRKVEDSLDVWNNYVYWDRPGFYAEVGLGLKLREGGFYDDGSPFIVNVRVGKRFKFGQR